MLLRGEPLDGPRAFELGLGLAIAVGLEHVVDEWTRELLASVLEGDAEVLRSIVATTRGR